MNTWEQKHRAEARPSPPAPSTSTQGLGSSTVNPSSIPPFTLIDLALLMAISVACLSAISLTIGKLSWVYRQKIRQQSFPVQPANTMPCQGCQYFCANPYLKCTVHPTTVMTEASSNCSDYAPPKR
jgi:hypothetical protein